MESFDIVIIGAGVIGLSAAASLSAPSRRVLILEKNDSWGQEASSRNSEVIHAGIYYPPKSLKAVACVEGRSLLYELCAREGIGCRKIGKLIVAVDKNETAYLDRLRDQASRCGVPLDMAGPDQTKKIEPRIDCVAALYSPETGLVDSHQLMEFFLSKAEAQEADLVCRAEVVGLRQEKDGWVVGVNNQGEDVEIQSRVVINCAGLHADRVAAMAGIDTDKAGYAQYFLRGSYFRLADKYRDMTSHLVYPVPGKNSLGIHTVLDLSGGLRLGPDEEKIESIDYRVDPGKAKVFYDAAKRFLPFIEAEDLSPDMAGIRAQLKQPNRGNFKDFIVADETAQGFPGLINCIGIESPGLTASCYLGGRIASLARALL